MLEFGRFTDNVSIASFTDSDFAKDREGEKSISAYIVTVCGNCISGKSKL